MNETFQYIHNSHAIAYFEIPTRYLENMRLEKRLEDF